MTAVQRIYLAFGVLPAFNEVYEIWCGDSS
jgi:hypothetical protein